MDWLVPEAEKLSNPWYLFNDFVVKNISEQEALGFHDKWKVGSLSSPGFGWISSDASRLLLSSTLSERIYKTHLTSAIYRISPIYRF